MKNQKIELECCGNCHSSRIGQNYVLECTKHNNETVSWKWCEDYKYSEVQNE